MAGKTAGKGAPAKDSSTAPRPMTVWEKLAARLPDGVREWRQQGKPKAYDGRFKALFVGYIEAGFVRERLDEVVPGEWSLVLDILPAIKAESAETAAQSAVAIKARLTVRDCTREDIGHGKDYKQASTDAFKRVAVRYGIGHELYQLPKIYVRMDSEGKYAKPLDDPEKVFQQKHPEWATRLAVASTIAVAIDEEEDATAAAEGEQRPHPTPAPSTTTNAPASASSPSPSNSSSGSAPAARPTNGGPSSPASAATTAGSSPSTPSSSAPPASSSPKPRAPSVPYRGAHPACPICLGKMWDQREGKRNAKAPDFRCRGLGDYPDCDGKYWPNQFQKEYDEGRAPGWYAETQLGTGDWRLFVTIDGKTEMFFVQDRENAQAMRDQWIATPTQDSSNPFDDYG